MVLIIVLPLGWMPFLMQHYYSSRLGFEHGIVNLSNYGCTKTTDLNQGVKTTTGVINLSALPG